ncbi:MAG: hypothetical protein K9G61_09165 [Bacteroidales bacterium]|nr:hypothetical protein [Bacteroidales bacterium]
MILFEDLQKATGDVVSLQAFLLDNFEKVYDFFTHQKHADLLALRSKLNRYIQLNRNVILNLNIDDTTNLAFISLLLDISEELGLLAPFRFLYKHLEDNNYNIGNRLKAASLFLIGINTADDYIIKYETIYSHLQRAAETEEDNTDRVLMTMVHYYAQVVYDFGEFNTMKVIQIKAEIEKSLSDNKFTFLHNKLIDDILTIDISHFSDAYHKIFSLLDTFLGRDIVKPAYRKDFVIETETEYCKLLASAENSFSAVRQISVSRYELIQSDSIFYSLGRGVAILTDEKQLYAYMYSYGNMHYHKLIESLKKLPPDFFSGVTNIVDWGCGQAMASIAYFDFLIQIGIKQGIENITLIEPSEIALKRASLHIKKYYPFTNINTINKDLDAIESDDFINNKTKNHIHLFSNILDIEDFSLTNLLDLIHSNFNGENYFICVSPYINDTRTSRLDAFVRYFSKMNGFNLIDSVDNRAGEWAHNWTRVVRVFKVSL